MELDPLYMKALPLLLSRSKTAAEQLHTMAAEAAARYNAKRAGREERAGSDSDARDKLKRDKKDAKRQAEKVGESDSDSAQDAPLVKRPRTESPLARRDTVKAKPKEEEVERTVSPAVEKVRTKEESSPRPPPPESDSDDSDVDALPMNADAFAADMGLACVVCRSLDVKNGNQLMECSECQALYHQRCHRPAVKDEQRDDPRLVWLCQNCRTSLHKTSVSGKSSKSKASRDTSHKDERRGERDERRGERDEKDKEKKKSSFGSALNPFQRSESSKGAGKGAGKAVATWAAQRRDVKPAAAAQDHGFKSSAQAFSGLLSKLATGHGKSVDKAASQSKPQSGPEHAQKQAADKLKMMKKKAADRKLEKKSSYK